MPSFIVLDYAVTAQWSWIFNWCRPTEIENFLRGGRSTFNIFLWHLPFEDQTMSASHTDSTIWMPKINIRLFTSEDVRWLKKILGPSLQFVAQCILVVAWVSNCQCQNYQCTFLHIWTCWMSSDQHNSHSCTRCQTQIWEWLKILNPEIHLEDKKT
jgi:hypothetical protein